MALTLEQVSKMTKAQAKEELMRRHNITTEEEFKKLRLRLRSERVEQHEQARREEEEEQLAKENRIKNLQEVANRDLIDGLPTPLRKEFDEALNAGKISSPDFPGSRLIEPLGAVATGIASQIGSGLAGAVTAPFQGSEKATQNIKDIQEKFTFSPKTKSGRAGLKTLGDLVQSATDIINFPISGLAGLAELTTGQGLDQADSTVSSIQERGVGETLGDRILEETGSPLLAAAGETLPEAILLGMGVKKIPGAKPKIGVSEAKNIDEVLKAGKARNIDVLTSDIFPPKTIFKRLAQQFAERIPVLGTGGKRAKQQAQRIKALEELDSSLPSVNPESIFESLQKSADKKKIAAGNRINKITTDLNFIGNTQTGPIPVANSIKNIDKAIDRLTSVGKLPDASLLKTLEELKITAKEAGLDFKTLREFRTDARSIVDKVDPVGRSQLRSSDKATMDKVISGITRDLDDYVLQQLGTEGLRRYKHADNIYRQEARKLTKSRLKIILDKGDLKPELVNNLLFSSSPSEINLLFKNLDTQGRQHARVALYRRALENSAKGNGLSPSKFITELDKLKNNFNVFFRDGGKAELNGLRRLLKSTQRASEAGVVTPTGQATQFSIATGATAGAAVGSNVALASLFLAGTVGLSARIFNSSGVRDMLIKLGKSKKRSTLEADLLKSIPIAIEQSNQTLARENEKIKQAPNVNTSREL